MLRLPVRMNLGPRPLTRSRSIVRVDKRKTDAASRCVNNSVMTHLEIRLSEEANPTGRLATRSRYPITAEWLCMTSPKSGQGWRAQLGPLCASPRQCPTIRARRGRVTDKSRQQNHDFIIGAPVIWSPLFGRGDRPTVHHARFSGVSWRARFAKSSSGTILLPRATAKARSMRPIGTGCLRGPTINAST